MTVYEHSPHREIRAVVFDGDLGLMTIDDLMQMPSDRWGMLRDRVTDRTRGKSDELIARCLMCGSRVYIQARAIRNARFPLFAHFSGGDPSCPWYQGRTNRPDDLRALQYRGQQESEAHRRLSELIDRLARQDKRYVRGTVGTYLPPKEGQHGRFPDVYVEWAGFAPFVFELQLSYTSVTEVSDRYLHYRREGANLIWVLVGIDGMLHDLPQNFRDVIRRHRGNAFVLDQNAVRTSNERRTLVLTCLLQREDGTFDAPRQIGIEELTFPEVGLAFFEDRIVGPLLARCAQGREPWYAALRSIGPDWDFRKFRLPEVIRAVDSVADLQPRLLSDQWEALAFLKLMAAILTTVNAAADSPENLLSRQPNIKATLNSALNNKSDRLMDCAPVFEFLIERSPLSGLLRDTVGRHIDRARTQLGGSVIGPHSWQWEACRRLVPEVFDSGVREQLAYYRSLPGWASPA